jgi:hypothetical protein
VKPPKAEEVAKAYIAFSLTPSAPLGLVKKARDFFANRHHPDKGGNPKVMQQINHAYEVLRAAELYREEVYKASPVGESLWNLEVRREYLLVLRRAFSRKRRRRPLNIGPR